MARYYQSIPLVSLFVAYNRTHSDLMKHQEQDKANHWSSHRTTTFVEEDFTHRKTASKQLFQLISNKTEQSRDHSQSL